MTKSHSDIQDIWKTCKRQADIAYYWGLVTGFLIGWAVFAW